MRITFLGNFRVDFTSESHHAKSLEALGHEVVRLQEPEVPGQDVLHHALNSDALVWVHTHGWMTPGLPMREVLKSLRRQRVPTLTYHLDLWFGIQRQRDMQTDDYWHIQHFFTVDKLMAQWLTDCTDVEGHYIQAGVFGRECYMSSPSPSVGRLGNDVIFVGSKRYHPEWQYRPQLIDWLQRTYGNKFGHYGHDGLGVYRGGDLNQLYADSSVVVGDSLCIDFKYPHYWSDRVYETLGRGGFMIHPYIRGLEEHFEDGVHLRFYEFGNWDQLRDLIDYYLIHEDEREHIRRAGHEHVRNNHTYIHRWEEILRTIGLDND